MTEPTRRLAGKAADYSGEQGMTVTEAHVVEDCEMPEGHDWLRLRYPDGRIVTLIRKSVVAARHLCQEGPLQRRQ